MKFFSSILVTAAACIGSAAADVYGTATYYDVSGLGENNWHGKSALTACGWQSTNGEMIVAMNYRLYDKYTKNGNPNDNYLCQGGPSAIWVWTTGYGGRNKGPILVYIVDRMENPARGENDIDLSPAAFKALSPSGTYDEGVLNIGWNWK